MLTNLWDIRHTYTIYVYTKLECGFSVEFHFTYKLWKKYHSYWHTLHNVNLQSISIIHQKSIKMHFQMQLGIY